MGLKRLKAVVAVAVMISMTSCTSFRAYQQGQESEINKDWDQAVAYYTKALEVDPSNVKYTMSLQRAKMEASRMHFKKGQSLRAKAESEETAGRLNEAKQLNEMALVEYELTVRLDPTNQFAAVQYGHTARDIQDANYAAQGVSIDEMKRRAISKAQPPQLNPASNEPLSLSFPRPTPVKDIYRALGNSFGINVVFDQAVKDDERISIELRDVTAQQALERVMQAANHFYKILDERTIIVVPDTPQTRRDYEDLVIRTFYLSNGDAEQVTNVIRTMLEARNVFPLKALNAITIRDTADKVLIAEKIIQANDKAKAEVVVQVELLQVDSTKMREIGMNIGSLGGTSTMLDAAGNSVGSLRLNDLSSLALANYSFTVPTLSYRLLKESTDATLLAQPSLRISEGEDATLHIGRKQPIPVSTLYTTVGTGGGVNQGPIISYQYQDIGIKISITPRVHHNREVSLKLTVEVSNLAGSVGGTSATDPVQPIIGTRTIQSTIRLKDGETNFLAGLLRQDDSIDRKDTPFLSDLPIIGRLFSKDRTDHIATDVVLTMTPHIIRIPDITDDDLAPMWVGTLNNITFRGLTPRVESAIGADPFVQRPQLPGEPAESNTEWFAPAVGDRTVAPPPAQQPAQPASPIPPPTGPSDPFRQPQPVPSPTPQPPGTTPQGGAVDGGAAQNKVASTAAADDSYQLRFSPRIAPQPSRLALKPGEETSWSVVGMDLAGLVLPQLVFHYDPMALDVASAAIGPAFLVDLATPPAVTIDASKGTIRVISTDGKPLRFQSGGEVLALRVRGGITGQTMLIVEPPSFSSQDGARVDVAVAGGMAQVQ
jgi:general secretion pathway protein D